MKTSHLLVTLSIITLSLSACAKSDFRGKDKQMSATEVQPAEEEAESSGEKVKIKKDPKKADSQDQSIPVGTGDNKTVRSQTIDSVTPFPTVTSQDFPTPDVAQTTTPPVPTATPEASPAPKPSVAPELTFEGCAEKSNAVQATNVQCDENKVAIGMGLMNRSSKIDALKCCSLKFSSGELAQKSSCTKLPLAHKGATAFCAQNQLFVGFETTSDGTPYVGICCSFNGPEGLTVQWNGVVENPSPEMLNPNYWPGVISKDTFPVVGTPSVITTCPSGVMSGAGDQYQPDMSFDQIKCHNIKAAKP